MGVPLNHNDNGSQHIADSIATEKYFYALPPPLQKFMNV
jgi:hypothetical protein